jgi:hypothetical protein
MAQIAWGRFAVLSSIIIGAGYATMKLTTPNEDQLFRELSPELRRQALANKARRQAEEQSYKMAQDILPKKE